MPQSTIAGSCDKCMFSIKETTQLYSGVTIPFCSYLFLKRTLNKKTPLLFNISYNIYYSYFKNLNHLLCHLINYKVNLISDLFLT